jgi:hypothetical protein
VFEELQRILWFENQEGFELFLTFWPQRLFDGFERYWIAPKLARSNPAAYMTD